MPRGGARTPNNPAPVSGPGALSRRTDGGPGQPIRVPTGGDYGDATQLQKLQQSAPLAESPGGNVDLAALLGGGGGQEVTPLSAPTQQPDTPVTDGALLGAGAGPEALGLTETQQDQDMQRLLQYLPVFEHMANLPNSSKAARNLVRTLKGML